VTKLEWPTGWPRTRPGERKEQRGWKKPESVYRKQLTVELERMKAFGIVIQTAPPDIQRLDPGVVVYFSLPSKEDYSWQDILELYEPAPTPEQVRDAYLRKYRIYHTDIPGTGDLEMSQRIEQAKRQALQYISQRAGETHQHCIPLDKFKEVRWNIAGLARGVSHIRGLERVGIPGLLERAMKGLAAIPEEVQREHAPTAA
jgi:hypothetical protein